MHTHLIALYIGVLAMAVAASPGLPDLPPCAMNAFLFSVTGTGCSLTDTRCFCSNSKFLSDMEAAVKAKCSPDDQQKALNSSQKMCPNIIQAGPQVYTSTSYYTTTTDLVTLPPSTTFTTTKVGIVTDGDAYSFPVTSPPPNTSTATTTSINMSPTAKTTTTSKSEAGGISLAFGVETVVMGIVALNGLMFVCL